jgi:hypothetical protein
MSVPIPGSVAPRLVVQLTVMDQDQKPTAGKMVKVVEMGMRSALARIIGFCNI